MSPLEPYPDELPSRLFVLRVWLEPGAKVPGGWRACLLNPLSHQRHYFSEPAKLSAYLAAMNLNWPEDLPDDHD